jgi:hypothetical protein
MGGNEPEVPQDLGAMGYDRRIKKGMTMEQLRFIRDVHLDGRG